MQVIKEVVKNKIKKVASLTLIAYLTIEAQFWAWGWRIPFLFSAVLIVLALWIRSSIQETAVFQEQKDSGDIANLPIAETFRHHRKSLFHVIGLKYPSHDSDIVPIILVSEIPPIIESKGFFGEGPASRIVSIQSCAGT